MLLQSIHYADKRRWTSVHRQDIFICIFILSLLTIYSGAESDSEWNHILSDEEDPYTHDYYIISYFIYYQFNKTTKKYL